MKYSDLKISDLCFDNNAGLDKFPVKVSHENRDEIDHLIRPLNKIFNSISKNTTIVIFCIGTEYVCGDALGPLVGFKLSNMIERKNVVIYGKLNDNVNAKNLSAKLEEIKEKYDNSYIVAVDSCLGKQESVGYVNLHSKPLKPGLGVGKELPTVGNISITGIVNIYDKDLSNFFIQNTKLSLVMKMSDYISEAIAKSL